MTQTLAKSLGSRRIVMSKLDSVDSSSDDGDYCSFNMSESGLPISGKGEAPSTYKEEEMAEIGKVLSNLLLAYFTLDCNVSIVC